MTQPVPDPAPVESLEDSTQSSTSQNLPPMPPKLDRKMMDVAEPHAGKGLKDQVPTSDPNHPRNLYTFLSPAEGPDEIGRLGPYGVLSVLGAGGMGVVFQARDPKLDRLIALKAMLPALVGSPSAKERFCREAKAVAALKHPHIITIFQIGEEGDTPYIAMEFLNGESLDDLLKRQRRLPLPDALRIGRQIGEGLTAAHEHGLIHRDIKPSNIWLETPPQASPGLEDKQARHVKILDFGLVRNLADHCPLTQPGLLIGSVAYMAPEQAAGQPVDHRCDLFSWGCVLYRMCSGERPFKGSNVFSILSALAMETPAPLRQLNPRVPAELSELILKLLAKDPEDRPSSARAVINVLWELEAGTQKGRVPGKQRATLGRKARGEKNVVKAKAAARTLPSYRILIVEDSPEDLCLYRRLLNQDPEERFDVVEASTCLEGLACLRAEPPPDCILLDYQLPDFDGLSFLDELANRKGEDTPALVMLTGQGSESVAVQAMKRGAQDYLVKGSITGIALRRAIHNAMEKIAMQRTIDKQRRELERLYAEEKKRRTERGDSCRS